MPRISCRPSLPSLAIALMLVLTGCGTPASSPPDTPSLEKRMDALELRMQTLEARPVANPPYRSRQEIEAHIETLEAERRKLLTRYFAEHPEIRDIDRKLGLLRSQLKMLE